MFNKITNFSKQKQFYQNDYANLWRNSNHLFVKTTKNKVKLIETTTDDAMIYNTMTVCAMHNVQTVTKHGINLSFKNHIRNILFNLNNKIKSKPVLSAMMVACLKATVCDILVQTFFENKYNYNDWDYGRILFFSQWGLWYGGLAHYHLYVRFFPFIVNKLFENSKFLRVFGQIFGCLMIYSPFIYFPIFYMLKQQFYDKKISIQSCKNGFNSYYPNNFKNDIKRLCSIWIPAHMITFTVVPLHLRIFWMSSVSFIWTMVLSAYNGSRVDTAVTLDAVTDIDNIDQKE